MIKENREKFLEKINAATQCKMPYANSSDNDWKTSTDPAKAMIKPHRSTGISSSNNTSGNKSKTLAHINHGYKQCFRRSRSEIGIKQCRDEKMKSVISTEKQQASKTQSPITIKSSPLSHKTKRSPHNITSGINTSNKQMLTSHGNRRHKSASLNRKHPVLIIVLNESRRGDYPEKKYHSLKKNCVATSLNVEKQNVDVIRECEEKPQYTKTVVIVNEKIYAYKSDLLKRYLVQSVPENIQLSSSRSHNIRDNFFKLILIMNLTQYLLHTSQSEITSDILIENIIGEDLCYMVKSQNSSAHRLQYYLSTFEESSTVYISHVSTGNSWIEEMQMPLQNLTDDNSYKQYNEFITIHTNRVIYTTLIPQEELKNRLRIVQQAKEQCKVEPVTQTIRGDNANIDNLIVTPFSQIYPTNGKHQEVNIIEKISEKSANMKFSEMSYYERNNFVSNQFTPVKMNEKNLIANDLFQQPLAEFILSHTEGVTKDHSQINGLSHHSRSVEFHKFNRKADTGSGFSSWLVKFINSGCIRRRQKTFVRRSASEESILSSVSHNINGVVSLKEVSNLLSLLSNTDEHKNSELESTKTLNVVDVQPARLEHKDVDPNRISNQSQDFSGLLHNIKTRIRFSDEDVAHEDNYKEDCTNNCVDNKKSNSLRNELPVNDEIKPLSKCKYSSNDESQMKIELEQYCKQTNELGDSDDRHLNKMKTLDSVSAPSSVSTTEHQKQETTSSSVLTNKTDQLIMPDKRKYLKQTKQKQPKKKAPTNITNLLLKLIDRKRRNIVDNRIDKNKDSQQDKPEKTVSSLTPETVSHPIKSDDTTLSVGNAGIRKSVFLVKQKPIADAEWDVNKLKIQSKVDSIICEYDLRDSGIFPRSRSETRVENKRDVKLQAIIGVENTVLKTALERISISFEVSLMDECNKSSEIFTTISDKHKITAHEVYILAMKRHHSYIHEPDTIRLMHINVKQVNHQAGELFIQLQSVREINNLEALERTQDPVKWMLVSEKVPPEQNYLMCTISLRLFNKLEKYRHEQLQIEDDSSNTISWSLIKHYMNSMRSLEVYRPSYRCCSTYSKPFTEPPGLYQPDSYHNREDTNRREEEADDATCFTGSLVSFLTSSDKILDGDNNKDDRVQHIRHYNSMTEASIFNDDESDSCCLRHHSSSDHQQRLTKINPVLAKPVNNLKTKKMQLYFPILLQRETEFLYQSVELSKTDSNETTTTTATMTVISVPTAEMNSVSSCKYIQY